MVITAETNSYWPSGIDLARYVILVFDVISGTSMMAGNLQTSSGFAT
jgi:hypothetical protein